MKKFFFAIAAMVLCLEIVPAAADLAELEKKFADSIVKVAFELKYDEKGDAPGCIGVYCSGCSEFHDSDPGQLLADKRDLLASGFVVAPQEIIAPAVLLEPEGIKGIYVIYKNKKYPAVITDIYPEQMALKLHLASGVPGMKALEFVPYNVRDKLYAYSTVCELGRWVRRCRGFSPAGDSSIMEGQRAVFALPGNSLIVNNDGQAVGMVLNSNGGFDNSHWLADYKKWKAIPMEKFADMRCRLKAHLQKSVFPATIFMQEWKLSRRERLMNIAPEREIYGYVFAMPDGRLFMPLLTTPQQNSLIEKIVVHLPGRDQNCVINGVMNSLGGFVLSFADLTKIALDPIAHAITPLESNFGEMVWGVEVGVYPRKLYFTVYSDVIAMIIRQYHNIGGAATLKKGVPEMLFSLNGNLLGLNLSVRAFNYNRLVPFIDAAQIRDFMDKPEEMLAFDQMCNPPDSVAFLGVEYQAVTPALIQSGNIEHLTNGGREGLLITYVYPGSSAEKMGLKPGDILLKIILPDGGEPIKLTGKAFAHPQERQFPWQNLDSIPEHFFSEIPEPWQGVKNRLSNQLTNIGINKTVALIAVCGGRAVGKEFSIAAAPPYFEIAPAYRSSALGVEVRDITFEVRRYFRMSTADPGVIISDVSAGRTGSVAGLRPFEIITAVDEKTVKNVKDFARAISGKSEIRLSVRRLGANRVVTVKLPVGPRK